MSHRLVRAFLVRVVLSAALLLTLVPPLPAAASPLVVKIAVAVPLTQGATELGQGLERGAKAAVLKYNASQRFQDLGISVQVAAADDQGDPRTAVNVASLLVSDPAVLGVVGHLNSGCSIPASAVYARAHLAMVSPMSTNPALTQQGLDNVFRTVTTDAEQGPFLGWRASEGLLLRRAVVVDDSTPYGEGLASGFSVTFRKHGGSVLAAYKTSDRDTDFAALVTRVKALRPDVVFYGGIYNAGSLLAKQLRMAGVSATVVGGDGFYDQMFIRLAGSKNAEGDYADCVGLPVSQLPGRSAFVSAYATAFPGVAPLDFCDAYAFDAASAILEAIASVAEESGTGALSSPGAREQVRAKVAATDLAGVTGHVSFDSKGDTTNKQLTMSRVRSGVWEPTAWKGVPARVAGADRYGTAILVSKRSFPATAAAVVLATGRDFPDALSAGPLARAYGGPVLLVRPTGLSDDLRAEITRLAPADVFIVGSGSVVPTSVATALAALPFAPRITRLAGSDRFQTAAAVARQVRAKRGAVSKVVVVTGYDFPDALSVAPLAAAQGWPILLTRPSALPTPSLAAIADVGAGAALVIGSETVVSPSVVASLPHASRLWGKDRFATAGAVMDYAAAHGLGYGYLAVVTGRDFPDALAAGPLAAQNGGMLVLLDRSSVSWSVAAPIVKHRASLRTIDVIGGTGPLSDFAASRLLTQF